MRDSLTTRARRGLAMALLLAALLVRAAIPQGYMVESTETGALAITICHSDIAWQVPVEVEAMHHDQMQMAHGQMDHGQMDQAQMGHESKGHDQKGHGEPQPCAFAVAVNATPPADFPSLPLPRAVAEAFVRSEAPFALATAARQLPPARAPPAFA
ncbi:hypothetical protein GRI89_03710 [Altererythrobacter salegens]|uniref:DUF2946 domain-containing protein n=1 Tax=Croceibacterium salegens TaxID=1737568 RepID=A0A6I4SU87_9SPHN|nr:hypothetical protein [Croceibacterium salegens]MXO58647.1 hypothetical protein [Croceibacterium salegens]